MIKDIEIRIVEDLVMAVIPQAHSPESDVWEVFLINLQQHVLTDVLVSSKGFGTIDGDERQTSELRHYFEQLKPMSYQMIEHIQAEVFSLNNQYWVTFKSDSQKGYLFDKKYTFVQGSIDESNFTDIPLIGRKGVMIG